MFFKLPLAKLWIILKFALLDNNNAMYSSMKASFYNVQESKKK